MIQITPIILAAVADEQLSFAAKGLVAVLARNPNGVLFQDLVKASPNSPGSVRRVLKMLSARKYVLSALIRKNGKLVGRQWILNPNFSGHE